MAQQNIEEGRLQEHGVACLFHVYIHTSHKPAEGACGLTVLVVLCNNQSDFRVHRPLLLISLPALFVLSWFVWQATFSTPEFLGLNSPGGPDPNGGWKQSATSPRQLSGRQHTPRIKAVRNAYDEFVGPDADDWMIEASHGPDEWEERDVNHEHDRSYDDDLHPGGDVADYRQRQRPSVWDLVSLGSAVALRVVWWWGGTLQYKVHS